MTSFRIALPAALFALALSPQAQATLGVFEHGNGIKSMGAGGVGYSFAEESTVLGTNPAHALGLGHRYDVGTSFFGAEAEASFKGNALGPDEGYFSDGREYYYIPQGGYSRPLSDRWAIGVAVLSAGLGPDYDGSPFERFGGADRLVLSLASSGIVTALAYQIAPAHAVGLSLNTGYQVLSIEGLEFLATPEVSSSPQHVTNQGRDGSFNIGFTLGWTGRFTPWLSAGAAYRSKSWTQKHKEYEGIVAGGGELELPAIYGGGFTLTPIRNLHVVLEAQRFEYASRRAFGNRIGNFTDGNLFGEANGAGFGFQDQNAYKLGIAWQATPALMLRAGYVHATSIVQRSQTLFSFLGCLTTTDNYSIGLTYQVREWEFSGLAFNTPKRTVRGENSIPEAFGGGEASTSDLVYGVGFSLGRRFGR